MAPNANNEAEVAIPNPVPVAVKEGSAGGFVPIMKLPVKLGGNCIKSQDVKLNNGVTTFIMEVELRVIAALEAKVMAPATTVKV